MELIKGEYVRKRVRVEHVEKEVLGFIMRYGGMGIVEGNRKCWRVVEGNGRL